MSKKKEEKQIDSIFEAIINLAQLNYSTKAIITDSNTQLDAIASGVNMMGEQLERLVNSEKEKTEFLKNSEEISHLGSWELKLLTNQLIWSDEVYRLFGLQPQEFAATYEAFLDAVHPDDRAKVDAAYTNSVKEGKDCYEIEHRLLNSKTGELKYVIEKCRHERNASGNIIRSIGFVQDITEWKKAEESIRQSEMRLNAAQTITKLGSWEADLITGAVVWSDELYRIYNCNLQSFTPSVEALISLLHPDYKEAMSNWIAGTMQGKEQTPLEVQLADGSNKWIRSQGQVVFDDNGKPVKVRGTGQDITENKEAEIALEKSNREITDLKHGLDEASIVAITDTKGIIQYANNNFCKISGYSREELIGQDHRIINSGYHTKKFIRELWVTIANGKIWKGELKNKAKDGSYYWVDTTIVPLLDRKGKPFQYVAIRINITDRKKTEENLQKKLNEVSEYKNLLQNQSLAIDRSNSIIEFDLEGTILTANENFLNLFDYSLNEIQGKNHGLLLKAEQVDTKEYKEFWNHLRNGKFHRGEFERITKDGRAIWIQGSYNPIFDVEGKLIKVIKIVTDITKRKQSEEELFIKNEWYNQTLTSLGDGVITTDINGIVTLINRAACELLGCTKLEVIGNHVDRIFEISNEKTGLKVLNPLMEALQKNKIIWIANHTILKRKDGSNIFIDDSGAPINDREGKIIGGVLIFRDVTERKKVEEELLAYKNQLEQKVQDRTTELSNALEELKKNETLLRESHEQLQKLTEKILAAIYQFEITADGKMSVPFVSKSIEQLLPGVTAAQVMNDATLAFASVHPEDLQTLMQSIDKSRQQLTEWNLDFRIVTQDGAIKWITGSSRQEKKENGTIVWFGYLEDVTEKKKAEDQIFKSQQRYKNLLDNMNDGFIVDDVNGKVIFANIKFLEIFGLAEDEIPTLVLEDYIAPDYRAMIRERHNRRIAGEPVPANFEYVGLTKQGKKIWLGVRVSPIIENGIITGTQSVIRDISEIKKAEDEMNRYNVELKKTNTELDRFVYSTSHDLRAPLKSMLGLIGIIRENLEPSNTGQMDRIDMLNKSVLKLDNFIEDILHYARNSRMEVAKEEINFEEMINDIRHNHKFMEEAIGLKVTVKIRQAEKFISDKERIKVILNNLISNGIKYKDNSKENSFVNIMVQGSKENTIITVEDNGIGIAEDKQEKIFEMFYRATKQSTGSGLGMYIVKETIEKLDGQITMESILNKGSKFVVSLPNQFVTLT